MNNRLGSASLAVLLLIGFSFMRMAAAQKASGSNFSENCARALTDDAREWFAAKLDEIQAALVAGDSTAAQLTYYEARELPRTADVSVDVKCVGQARYSRYYDIGIRIKRADSAERPDDYALEVELAVADGREAGAIADLVPLHARAYGNVRGRLQSFASSNAFYRERGAFLLPAELDAETTAEAALAELASRADDRVAALLDEEQAAFTGPIGDGERSLASSFGAAEAFATSLVGVAPESGRAETADLIVRASLSTNALGELEPWLSIASGATVVMGYERAELRGDTMLAEARNEAYAYAVRDDLYDIATRYFAYADATGKQQAVASEQAAIAPALAAERAARKQSIEEAANSLASEAASLERAAESLIKTDEEREAFESEADALEAELGL
jgi:hypothetical protein